jgi:hypothetical protein
MDDGNISAEEATNLYDLFGAEATDLISALESGAISVDDFSSSIGVSGQTVEEMATANASLGEKFSELKNKIMAELAPALLDLADVITQGVDWLLADGIPAFEKFGKQLFEVLGPILVNLQETFVTVFGIIRNTWELFSAFFEGDWDEVWTNVKEIFAGLLDLIVLMFERAVETVKLVWAGFKAAFGEAVSDTVDLVVDFFTGLPGRLLDLLGALKDAAKDMGAAILEGIIDGLAAAGGFVMDFARGIGDALIGAVNSMIQYINDEIPDKIEIPFAPDINLPDNPIPKIPFGATGGLVTKPTLAVIGEAGPEMVIPVGSSGRLDQAPGASPLSAFGGGDVNVYVETGADPREIGASVAWALATGGAA